MKCLLLSIAKSPALLFHHELNFTTNFLRLVVSLILCDFTTISFRCVQCDTEVMDCLFRQLRIAGDETPSLLQQYLSIASNALSSEAVKFLCTQMIPHSLSVISQAAVTIASKLVNGMMRVSYFGISNNCVDTQIQMPLIPS